MASTKKILIIDGNAIIHRAYHAIPQTLFTKEHELVNAVFGFTNMLLQAISKLTPDYIICAFDPPTKTFRNEMYSGYKENRKKMDSELANQLEKIHAVVNAFQIPIFQVAGFEADDVIGTIANMLKSMKNDSDELFDILILSGDRDLLQLLDENVRVILPGKSFSDMITYDKQAFLEKYGFHSESLVDYKALYGDTSDNIPGVKKVGEKTATDLIKQFSHIEAMYEDIEAIKPSTRLLLENGKESALLSKKLATIKCDVPLVLSLSDAAFQSYDENFVIALFQKLEFKSLLKKLPHASIVQVEKNNSIDYDALDYRRIESENDLDLLLKKISLDKLFSIDCETTSLAIIQNSLVGISIGFEDRSAFYIPILKGIIKLNEKEYSIQGNYPLIEELCNKLQNSEYKKVGHNIKFDLHALALEKIMLQGIVFDTMLASHLLNNKRNDLKGLIEEFEGITMVTFETLTNKGATLINDLDKEALAKYACADADMTFRLYKRFFDLLRNNIPLLNLYNNIELPLIQVLFAMEQKGIKIDVKFLNKLSREVGKTLEDVQLEIYKIVGHQFNIKSPKQLSTIIHEELKLPKGKKTKTGYATNERYFNNIGDIHPIIQPLRIYKELTKLKSTYIDVLPTLVDESQHLHTSYNQTITSTGRLSSTNPNLQNIPVRSSFGKQVRNAFIANENSLFVSFDYSQIELRIMAHLSQDRKLMRAFQEDKDIHTQTGQLIFNKDIISTDERRIAKTINFGIIYGISSYGLAGQLSIDRIAAQEFIDKYFQTFPQIYTYIEDQKKKVRELQFTTSLMGRKRLFEDINRVGVMQQQAYIRESINMPLQAANAEIIKIAMISCQKYIKNADLPVSMILQVHDELIFEYTFDSSQISLTNLDALNLSDQNENLKLFTNKIALIMENAIPLSVPVKVESSIGFSWGKMIKQK